MPALRHLLPMLVCALVARAEEPAKAPAPALSWHGSIWASGATSNRDTADGRMFLRTVEAPNGALSLDGLQLSADLALGQGWSFKATLLGGRAGREINDTSLETGSIAYTEAMLVWTGKSDSLKLGRMSTPMGMELVDQSLNVTASRGLMYNFVLPYGQVGLNWHHAFSSDWSTDVWLYNGEDRIRDNNHGKTGGLGLTYNHGGAADKFFSLMAFRGAEQDGLGVNANTGAEGRFRERISFLGLWTWGAHSLQMEWEDGRETFLGSAISGSTTPTVAAKFGGGGLIYKWQFQERWAAFARLESLQDERGIRLNLDPTVGTAYGASMDADLRATSFAFGVERKWGQVYTRGELRQDRLNREVNEGPGGALAPFRSALSLTWSVGASF